MSRLTEEKRLTFLLLIKTVVGISSLTIVTMFVGGWVIDRQHFTETHDDMEAQVNSIRTSLESIMLDSAGSKRERAQGYFVGEGHKSQFVNLRLLTPDNQVVFSKDGIEVGRTLDPREDPDCKSCHSVSQPGLEPQLIYSTDDQERVFHFVLPVENKERCQKCHDPADPQQGTLLVDFSLTEFDKRVKGTRMELLVILSIVSIVFISFTYYLLRLIAYEPLGLIAGRLKRMAGGDFSREPGQTQHDLIGFINRQIDSTATRLGELYGNLESEVEERTASLTESRKLLLEEKNKLSFIFDNSPQGLLSLSVDGIILAANRKAGEFVGVEQEKLIGRPVQEFELLEQIFSGNVVKRALSKEIVAIGSDRIFKTAGGIQYVDVQASLTTSESGDKILLLMLIDVSEKRKMDQKLEQHERLASIGQLAAGVAHEVGNPLSAISSLVQITQKTDQPDKLEHNLHLITYHINRISKIVRNLSEFARVTEEEDSETSIIEVIKGALEIASFDRRARHVEIDVKQPDNDVRMKVRRDQLFQAILNIVMNALDAMKGVESPRLKIRLYSDENSCRICVTDNGHGIGEENLQRVFEPFYTTKPPGEGTGLGLSVTYRIITDMGGDLEVESSTGVGTMFTITLRGVIKA